MIKIAANSCLESDTGAPHPHLNAAVALYSRATYHLLMTSRHSHARVPLLAASLLFGALCGGGALLSQSQPVRAAIPLDSHIPHEQALIDLGLSGTPGSSQPTQPIVVDRVLVDGASTYVQYHLSGSGSQTAPFLTLSDDHGATVDRGGYDGFTSSSDWSFPFPLPAWAPWRPRTIQRRYAIFAPLPATAHAAILQFNMSGAPGASGRHETVRVPLDLRALARRRIVHPHKHVRVRGVTLTVQDLSFTHLTYTYRTSRDVVYVTSRNMFAGVQGPYVADMSGRHAQVSETGPSCRTTGSGTYCSSQIIFPFQRPGTRLTLTIPAFLIFNSHYSKQRSSQALLGTIHGPWYVSFVTP